MTTTDPARGQKLRLGLFVAACCLAVGGLAVLFGRSPALFKPRDPYTILFPEAPGVQPGTAIRKSGVVVGEVTEVELDPQNDATVRVAIAVDRKYRLYKTEEATIARNIINNDTAIDFLPMLVNGQAVPRGDAYPPGATIPGQPPVTARSLLSQASGIIPNAQVSLARMVDAIEKFEKLEPSIRSALNSFAAFSEEGRKLLPEVRETNRRIQDFIGPADQPPVAPPAPFPPDGRGDAAPPAPPGFVAATLPVPPKVVAPPPVAPRPPANLRTLSAEVQELARVLRPAADDVRGAVTRLEPELTAAARGARQTFATANTTFENLNQVVGPENRKEFADTVKNLRQITDLTLRLFGGFDTLITDARTAVKNVNDRAVQAEAVLTDLRAVTGPLAQRGERVAGNIDLTLENLARTTTDVRGVVGQFARADGTVGKLLSDPALYQNLNDAAVGLTRVLMRADRVVRDLETFADKVARRPELIGVGGAVRPSTGLKEAPSAPVPSYRPDWPPAIPDRPTVTPNWLAPGGPNPPTGVPETTPRK